MERANATPEDLLRMVKESVFYAETESKKYIQYADYIIVLGKVSEKKIKVITLLYAEWFDDELHMQDLIDRHA